MDTCVRRLRALNWVLSNFLLTDRLAPGLENNTDVFQLEKSKESLTSKYLIFC